MALGSQAAFAATELVVVSGDHNKHYYDGDTDLASSAKVWKSKNFILGLSKDHLSSYRNSPFLTLLDHENFDEQFSNVLKNSNESNSSLFLYIDDHGAESTTDSIWDSGLQLANQKIYSHQAFSKTIKGKLDAGKSVQILASHCYGGGVMLATFERPLTCASAGQRAVESLILDDEVGDLHARAFLGELKSVKEKKRFDMNGDGETSLLEAHVAGTFSDYANNSEQGVSSFEYARYVLGVYPYQNEGLESEEILNTRKAARAKLAVVEGIPILAKQSDGFQASDHSVNLEEGFVIAESFLTSPPTALELRSLPENLKVMLQQFNKMPEVLKTIGKEDHRPKELAKLVVREDKLREEWNRVSDDPKLSTEFKERTREGFMGKMKEINKAYNLLDVGHNGLMNMYINIHMAASFWAVASNQQKKKFLELIECESRNFQ